VKAAAASSGARAEDIACRYLERQGLVVLRRNWRCRFGEIDLVLREGETIVFVEVRLRTRADYGGAAESIHAAKRARLFAAARAYLARSREPQCRFDAVLLDRLDPGRVEWIRNALSDD
jgi:putative endonuclease